MNTSGFYVLSKPGLRQVTEFEANQLIRKLLTNEVQITWDYNPRTLSENDFIGTGFGDGTERIQLSMQAVPHHNARMLLEYSDGSVVFAITDLCYEPEKSALRKLFIQVASTVHKNPKPKFRYTYLGCKA